MWGKLRLLLVLLLLWGLGLRYVAAQSRASYADSMMLVLEQTRGDTAKARVLMDLSDYWADRDSARATLFATRAISYTGEHPMLRGIGHFYLAGAYFGNDRAKSQQEYMHAEQLLRPFKTREALQYRSRAWHNYGVLEQHKGNSKSYVDILLSKAIPLARAADDEARVAGNYMDLGAVFMNFKDYSKAGGYYEKAIAILNNKMQYRTPVLAECYINKAKSYILQNIPDRSLVPLASAFTILKSTPDSSYLPVYYLVEGMYHTRKKQWTQAIADFDKGLAIAEELQRSYDASSILYEKYEVYKRRGQPDKAKPFLEQAYARQKDFPIAANERLFLYELAQMEEGLGNHKMAFDRLMQYTKLTDSFFSEKAAQEIADLEARNRLAEKENELLALQHHYELQKVFLFFGVGVLLLLAAFFTYVFQQRKKREAEQAQVMQREKETGIARAQLEGEERERQRLARDLHDGLGGMLASVKLNLSAVRHEDGRGQDSELQKAVTQLDLSIDELRRIARNMMPETLLRTGLANALKDLCKWMGGEHLGIEHEMLNVSDSMILQQKVDIYRIVQELLSNAARHSGATEVFVQCSMHQGRFYITVEDNGKGMPQVDLSSSEGMGFRNIRDRIAYMQGKIKIESPPGRGTIINIEVNVGEKE